MLDKLVEDVNYVFDEDVIAKIKGDVLYLTDTRVSRHTDFETLEDDFYVYNETLMCAVGRRRNNKFSLGDEVKVLVEKVDVETYEITFTLINHNKTTKIVSKKEVRKVKRGKKHGRY